MSLVLDLVNYIASQTSLTVDTDLFVEASVYDAPSKCVIVAENYGTDNESRVKQYSVQVFAKDLAPEDAKTLAGTVYDLLAHKPGFSDVSLQDIFYVDVLYTPAIIDRDSRGSFICSFSLLVRMK